MSKRERRDASQEDWEHTQIEIGREKKCSIASSWAKRDGHTSDGATPPYTIETR